MKRRPLAITIAAGVALALAGAGTAMARTTPPRATVTIGSTAGAPLKSRFLGFSFPLNGLAASTLTTGNLPQLMKTLGPGVMRWGGNVESATFWTSTGETAPGWAEFVLTPAHLQRLKTLADLTGWKAIIGVNLRQFDPVRAADEAKLAKQILGTRLLAIEVGNEPNYYPDYTPAQLYKDFEKYRVAMTRAAPGIGLTGPSVGRVPVAADWLKDFANRQKGHVDIVALATHYYPACGRSNPEAITIPALLSTDYRTLVHDRAALLGSLANGLKVPGLLTESNSVSCEGRQGVSDSFGSALWGVDNQLMVAQLGNSGMYLNSSDGPCGGPPWYTPFCALTPQDDAVGQLHAQPVYYAQLLIRQLGTGSFLPVSNNAQTNLRVYAVRNGTRLRIVIVNVTDPATTNPLKTTLKLPATYNHGYLFQLTAPSLSTMDGIRLGGHFVGRSGSYAGPDHTPFTIHGRTLTLSIPAGTATVISLTP
jgi:hypothetical protein